MRLDKFLVEKLGISRTKIQNDIKDGKIIVNKELAKVHEFLSIGDIVSFREKTPLMRELPKDKFKNGFQTASHRGAKQRSADASNTTVQTPTKQIPVIAEPYVILEKPDFLIIEKPAGLIVHEKANDTSGQPTLVDWLVAKYPEIKKVHDAASFVREDLTYRPGIVHRLDKDVSGLMIVARTQDAFDHFKKQFKEKKVRKEYSALVFGRIPVDYKVLDFPIGRSVSGKFVSMAKNALKAKPAITEIEVDKRLGGCTLVKAFPLTGRTNQIRAHLAAMGYPLIGDELYMTDKVRLKQKFKPGRVFLHAAQLTFETPEGKSMTVASPLPPELKKIIDSFK
jgi:23S rRNA pseudouridine1911/1915/1917 synthase